MSESGLKMKGPHLEACPFCGGHECFSVQRDKALYKCFQCPAQGDVFTFLENYLHLSPAEALERAAEIAGMELEKTGKRNPTASELIFSEAATYYHSHMLENGGRDYFISTRGHDEEILKAMRCGWTDGRLAEHLLSKGFKPDEIAASGLAKLNGEGRLVDYFAKNVAIFPHFESGKVLHFTIKDPKKKLKYQLSAASRSKSWRFYNQQALKYGELIIVEGENDLLQVMGAGTKHVVAVIGQVSEDQIKALQGAMKGKHIYLWFDRDAQGEKYLQKVAGALSGPDYNVRVIVHPGGAKDPDEYLSSFKGDRKREVKRLQEEALSLTAWHIHKANELDGLDEKLKALKDRRVFSSVADMVEAEKEAFVEKLVAMGFSRKAIDQQLELNVELRSDIEAYFGSLQSKRDADPKVIARKVFKYFSEHGRFFHDRLAGVFLLHRHVIYEVGNNRPFNALLFRSAGLLPTREPGRSVWEALASMAYNEGTRIDVASWIDTDRVTDTIFVNLNGPNNTILKVSKEKIEEVPNGLNKDGVLLKSSSKIMPVNFLPDTPIDEGMKELSKLVFDNLTCDLEQRYLILCWMMSAFLLDFAPYMGLMKFSGPSASGKTTAARLLSVLLYGTDHLGDPSAAAAYAVASQNPLLIIDNLEHDDFTKSILKFLLLSATKGGKEKRSHGTDSDTVEEHPKALVLITAIEPFTKAELINRTYDVEFSFKYKSDDFVEDEVVRALTKKRDVIMSAILKFVQKHVLSDLEKRREFISVLKKNYRGHAKNRTDEFLALMMLMLEKLLKYIPNYDFVTLGEEASAIWDAWIEYQDSKAKDTETTSNSIIKLLDGLVRETLPHLRSEEYQDGIYHGLADEEVVPYESPLYHLKFVRTKPQKVGEEVGVEEPYFRSFVEFEATSGDVCAAFDRYCRDNGLKNPYSTASVYASRLKNDRHLLVKGGWELIMKEGQEPYWRTIKGQRYYRFRKIIIR